MTNVGLESLKDGHVDEYRVVDGAESNLRQAVPARQSPARRRTIHHIVENQQVCMQLMAK